MNEIISEGLVMMCIGMGTVLLFLCTLIIAMNIMSFCVAKLNEIFPEVTPAVPGSKPAVTSNDDAVAVAIAVAISKN
ncbi:MAG: OadG family protein [Cyanobacteria bacterium RUI128]|nr:OadG family protein [Cyanobacteria bacterium RUI128]